jgi:GntP family gluconate:H+ symporter
MTPGIFIIVLAVAIAVLMLLIMKIKMHPVLALFLTTLGLGLVLGNGVVGSVNLINSGFGGTLKGIGVTIILGSILAMGIQDSGAATSIANFFIRLFRGKCLELAPALTAFIVSIPVFGDITMVLTAPIASILSLRRKISMSSMAAFTGLGLFLTHGLVPPTPGILAIALMYGADLGLTIFWGTIISAIAFFGTWVLLRGW